MHVPHVVLISCEIGRQAVDTHFTILFESNAPSARDAVGRDLRARRTTEFTEDLAKVFPDGVEEEEPGADLVQHAHDIWTFVVTHKEELKAVADLAKAAGSIVTALIAFAQGAKVEVTIVNNKGRKAIVKADHRADAERLVEDILRDRLPPKEKR
jgi:hypothetical protein